MKKVISLLLCMAMVMVLSSCSQKQEQKQIVASAYGVEFSKQQVEMSIAAYCKGYGMTIDELKKEKDIWERMKNDFVGAMIIEVIAAQKAEEMGYVFDDAGQKEFNDSYDKFLESLDKANQLEAMTDGANGKKDIQAAAIKLRERYFSALGYTSESYKAQQERYFITQKLKNKFREKITVTDHEIQNYYDNNLKSQKNTTGSATAMSANPLAPSTVIYHPNGYKYVKSLLLEFPSNIITLAAKMYSEKSPEFQPLVDREIELLKPKIEQIRAEIAAGASFDSLVEKYGQDASMTLEPTKSKGYFVANDDTQLIPTFKAGTDKLKKIGDIEECYTYKGYMFLYAQEIVAEGAAPFDEVKGVIKQTLLQDKQAIEWDRLTQDWLKEGKESGNIVMKLSLLD